MATDPGMWKVYYHDRSTFSSKDGGWADAPAFGVMGVAHIDDWVGYSRDTGDFYILGTDTQPWAVDAWGLMDYLIGEGVLASDERMTDLTADQIVAAGVKFGRSVANDEWVEVERWMAEDPELPHKSGRYRNERP